MHHLLLSSYNNYIYPEIQPEFKLGNQTISSKIIELSKQAGISQEYKKRKYNPIGDYLYNCDHQEDFKNKDRGHERISVSSNSHSYIYPEIQPAVNPVNKTNQNSSDEAIKIRKKDGVLWQCQERTPNPLGGYLYKFHYREEFNDKCRSSLTLQGIFPALEPLLSSAELTPQPINLEKIDELIDAKYEMMRQNSSLFTTKTLLREKTVRDFALQQLGYSKHEEDIVLPDREALLANWRTLKNRHNALFPYLSDLDIISSDGVAGNLEFVNAYMTHDGLLSEGKEFIHDHFYHIQPMIELKLISAQSENKIYESEKARLVELITPYYQIITTGKHTELDEVIMGAYVDTISSMKSFTELSRTDKNTLVEFVKTWQRTPFWNDYIKKQLSRAIDKSCLID